MVTRTVEGNLEQHQPPIASGVSSSSELEDEVGLGERLVARRIGRVRDRDHAHPGRLRRGDPGVGVLDRGGPRGLDAEPAARLEVDVRRRLAARHLLRRDGRAEVPAEARELEHEVDQLPVRRRRDAER